MQEQLVRFEVEEVSKQKLMTFQPCTGTKTSFIHTGDHRPRNLALISTAALGN